MLERLIALRQKQLKTFEEMTMFEVRILCKRLPKSINDLDKIISFDDSSVTSMSMKNQQNKKDHRQQEINKKHQKNIRDYKRQTLAKTFEEYETIIEENEYLYQEELLKFEYESSTHTNQMNNLMTCMNNYLNHRTNKIIREIRYKEAIFRVKLNHPRHRTKSSSTINKNINVYPEAIDETFENLFTDKELAFLSSIGNTRFCSMDL